MNEIPTALLIIAGLSFILLMAALLIISPHTPEDSYDIKRQQVGPTNRQRGRILLYVWLAPTLIAVAGWMVWG